MKRTMQYKSHTSHSMDKMEKKRALFPVYSYGEVESSIQW